MLAEGGLSGGHWSSQGCGGEGGGDDDRAVTGSHFVAVVVVVVLAVGGRHLGLLQLWGEGGREEGRREGGEGGKE